MSNAKKLRAFFEKVKVWPKSCKAELAKAVGMDKAAVKYTLKDFLKRGEIEEAGGYYRYVGKKEELLIDRVWRAWRYMPTWTVRDIVRLTDASPNTIKAYVRKYKEAGLIKVVSVRREGYGREFVYKLVSNERRRPW